MSDTKPTVASTGIGFPGLLAIVFITLKLCGVIAWSCLWVTAPLWIPVIVVLAGLAVFLTVALAWFVAFGRRK